MPNINLVFFMVDPDLIEIGLNFGNIEIMLKLLQPFLVPFDILFLLWLVRIVLVIVLFFTHIW